MFVILLTITDRNRLTQWSDAHVEWLSRGFDEDVFLLSGSARDESGTDPIGGLIIANGVAATDLRERIEADPFVAEGVATPTILEVAPSRIDEQLAFLADRDDIIT